MTTADLSTRESNSLRVPSRTLLGFGVIAGPNYWPRPPSPSASAGA